MKVTGLMDKRMELESFILDMEMFTTGLLEEIRKVVMGLLGIRMEVNLKENGIRTKLEELAVCITLMGIYMRENMRILNSVAMAFTNTIIETCMKANLWKTI